MQYLLYIGFEQNFQIPLEMLIYISSKFVSVMIFSNMEDIDEMNNSSEWPWKIWPVKYCRTNIQEFWIQSL